MPRVSRSFRNPKIAKDTEPLLWFALSRSKNPKEARALFDNFFTAEEKIMLSKRLAALYLIHKGLHYNEIADTLAISTATVGKLRYRYMSHKELFLPFLEELGKVERRLAAKTGKEDFLILLLKTQPSGRMCGLLRRSLGL